MSSGLSSQLSNLIQSDDACGLESFLNATAVSANDLSSALYEAIVHRSYQCLQTILKQEKCDPYLPIIGDQVCLPVLHHAVRLGDLHACKLLLDARIHPLVCAGHCLVALGSKRLCEDSVSYALHRAMESNRRNTIAVLLQTHLYSLVSAVVAACEAGDADRLKHLLPIGLRLQCSLNVLANSAQLKPTRHLQLPTGTITETTSTLHSDLIEQRSSSSCSWTSTTANFTGALALGSASMEFGKRMFGFTSERPLSSFSSLGGLLFSTVSGLEENAQPFANLLSDLELLSWTRSCLGKLLLTCVQRGHLLCLSLLLRVGFRVNSVSRPLGTECVDPLSTCVPQRYAFYNLLIEQSLQPSGSEQSLAHPWFEAPESDMDSAIHAAVRFNRIPFLEEIVRVSACFSLTH
ncbi:Protein kinase [Fasciola gigantica]|uniref:Protein kinase n=1 Tax=Fasciola gigantica TaxID=46835 RepID=A0A504YKL1_FASGI|nr:Protein kinase [Fasciola gigantica]